MLLVLDGTRHLCYCSFVSQTQDKEPKVIQLTPQTKILGIHASFDGRTGGRQPHVARDAEFAIRGLAMIHGIQDVTIFSDPGISGSIRSKKSVPPVPPTAQLSPGTIVVASKLDRVFRSASDALSTVEAWKAQGVDLILIDCGTAACLRQRQFQAVLFDPGIGRQF